MDRVDKISANELSRLTGISKQAILKEAHVQNWNHEVIVQNGGKTKQFSIPSIPSKYQVAVVKNVEDISTLDLTKLSPDANLAALRKSSPIEETPSSLNLKPPNPVAFEDHFLDKKIILKEQIVQEALSVPPGYKKRHWADYIAHKFGINRATVYRLIKKFKEDGPAGLAHTKRNKGEPKAWTPEALNFLIGLALKKEHRKISKKALYKILKDKAHQMGWNIGTYKNACWWLKKYITPQLLALQNGGSRELDNTLPPILRTFSDLPPLEDLCGDQRRYDLWVIDEETREVFRPEVYMWQDLRTRIIYGAAIGKKYDSGLMLLGLRIGAKFFGLFKNLYTDNGKPELSFQIENLIKEINGRHIKANFYNAKAKPIEPTGYIIECILRDKFLLPGYVKSLRDSKERQGVDEKEIKRLAESGKLTTWREFVIAFYNAIAYYNNEKPHRGVLREWKWKPVPKEATPMDCLNMCIKFEGWRPRRLSDDAIDLLFLAREKQPRVVDRGRILFNNKTYEHEKLITFHRKKVYLKFDPLDLDWVLVFCEGQYLCRAELVEYSSMKDRNLAQRKIHEKARLRREFTDQYRKLTSGISDIRQFSEMPEIERTAALVAGDKKQKALENQEIYRVRNQAELDAEIAAIERYNNKPKTLYSNAVDRFMACIDCLAMGKPLSEEDQTFYDEYISNMDESTKEYWRLYLECRKPIEGESNHEMGFCS